MRTSVRVVLTLGLLCLPRLVHAQNPVNPTQIEFDHADYATTDNYEVGYFTSATAAAPLQSGTLAKPTTCNPCSGTLPSRPTAFGSYWIAVRAIAGTFQSPWSNYVPFDRRPVAPTARRAF